MFYDEIIFVLHVRLDRLTGAANTSTALPEVSMFGVTLHGWLEFAQVEVTKAVKQKPRELVRYK
jgi:hypothetical protein